jgi:2-dehydro-3-deoxyphosphogluconate aldolase / (4S)-4-hydroxy-2-oxoglutarate aldolase
VTVTAEAFGDALRRHGIVAILRGVAGMTLAARVAALHAAGIRLIEISLSDLAALPLVAELRRLAPPDMLVGAGTVTSADLAAAAVEAGAGFLVTPHVAPDVIAYAGDHDLGILTGALTPTEIALARGAGSRFIKLFPATAMGPKYVGALLGPYPGLELVVVGGIGSHNVDAYLRAGAIGAGVAGALASDTDVGDFSEAADEARRLVAAFELCGRDRGPT